MFSRCHMCAYNGIVPNLNMLQIPTWIVLAIPSNGVNKSHYIHRYTTRHIHYYL